MFTPVVPIGFGVRSTVENGKKGINPAVLLSLSYGRYIGTQDRLLHPQLCMPRLIQPLHESK